MMQHGLVTMVDQVMAGSSFLPHLLPDLTFGEQSVRMLDSTAGREELTEAVMQQAEWPDLERADVAAELLVETVACCRELRFDRSQTAVALNIVRHCLAQDAAEYGRRAEQSFDLFQELLLKHSAERPPKSVGVFTVDQACKLAEFVTSSYYRAFSAYKHALAHKPALQLASRAVADLDQPPAFAPLDEGELLE